MVVHGRRALPILVTENGIGTDDDELRVRYVEPALDGVLDCLADGVDVRGYTYWSLLDNFEWAFGYGPRFGLASVDRTTFVRTPRRRAAHPVMAPTSSSANARTSDPRLRHSASFYDHQVTQRCRSGRRGSVTPRR